MWSTISTPRALSSEARLWRGKVWRVVEAQHTASTMKLVDSPAEQDLLEHLLEAAKPPLPKDHAGLDYLLATPFRYPPRSGGSRFRGATDPGVFYGAGAVRTACAELGYWRWGFLRDAVALAQIEPVAHTVFRAEIATRTIDLRNPPFDELRAAWTDPLDYGPTQRVARSCRQAELGAILYASVRDPLPGWCLAVLEPDAFARRKPLPGKQTWWLAVNQDGVVWRHQDESMVIDMTRWLEDGENRA